MSRRLAIVAMLLVVSATPKPAHAESPAGQDPPASPTGPDATAATSPDGGGQGTPVSDPKAIPGGSTTRGELVPVKAIDKPTRSYSPRGAALTLGGLYVAFAAYTYLAWYQKPIHPFQIDGDPSDGKPFRWLGRNTYAGGADKLGHAWSTLGLARVGTELLHQWGGYGKLESSIIGASLSEGLFLAVELVDGKHYVFSTGDLVFNTLGALLAVGQSNSQLLDDLVDFRVEYLPSQAYLDRTGDIDLVEDYSGQTYYLALHLGGIPPLREARWGLWSRFVDVVVGFKTRGYKPDPPWELTEQMPDYEMSQTVFLGLALNAQGVFNYLLEDRTPLVASTLVNGVFEFFSIPYTTLPVLQGSRAPTLPIGEGNGIGR